MRCTHFSHHASVLIVSLFCYVLVLYVGLSRYCVCDGLHAVSFPSSRVMYLSTLCWLRVLCLRSRLLQELPLLTERGRQLLASDISVATQWAATQSTVLLFHSLGDVRSLTLRKLYRTGKAGGNAGDIAFGLARITSDDDPLLESWMPRAIWIELLLSESCV